MFYWSRTQLGLMGRSVGGQAGSSVRAGTLALRLQALYADSERASAVATEVLEAVSSELFRVTVSCEECEVELDDALLQHPDFFLPPGERHRIVARFETGERREDVRATPGLTAS